MRSGIALVSLLVIVSCLLQDSVVLAGRSAPVAPNRKGDHGPLVDPGPPGPSYVSSAKSGLPYCAVDKDTTDFLKQIKNRLAIKQTPIYSRPRSRGRRGIEGSRATTPFPIPNCHHAALNWDIMVYNQDVYDCCDDCRIKFHQCLTSPNSTPIATSVLCSSGAIHCVNKCSCKDEGKEQPGKQKGTQGRPGPPGPKGEKAVCKEAISHSAGRRCIKKPCIPI